MNARTVAPVCLAALLFGLTGCDKLKDMLSKNQDAGFDAGVVDAAPVVAVPEDAGVDAAPAPVLADDIPGPADEEAKANRDIGFGNFKEELDKLEKEPDKKK
jgi:hypothetical protein